MQTFLDSKHLAKEKDIAQLYSSGEVPSWSFIHKNGQVATLNEVHF
jgi:hypothetical protein